MLKILSFDKTMDRTMKREIQYLFDNFTCDMRSRDSVYQNLLITYHAHITMFTNSFKTIGDTITKHHELYYSLFTKAMIAEDKVRKQYLKMYLMSEITPQDPFVKLKLDKSFGIDLIFKKDTFDYYFVQVKSFKVTHVKADVLYMNYRVAHAKALRKWLLAFEKMEKYDKTVRIHFRVISQYLNTETGTKVYKYD